MARANTPPIMAQLRTARTVGEQASALRYLKNDIVGHIQRKEEWLRAGVLEPIVKILVSSRAPAKQNGKEPRSTTTTPRALTGEESVRLQALQALAAFANGGPAFLDPIVAVGAIPAILTNVTPVDNPPQILTASLNALANIVEASTLALPGTPTELANLADKILVPHLMDAFCAILTVQPSSQSEETQILIVAKLISRLCREERDQISFVQCGILEALATRLASIAVTQGYVIPGADLQALRDGLAEFIPEPAPRTAKIGPILEAISAIVGDSRWRTSALAYSPALMAVFPAIPWSVQPAREASSALESLEVNGLGHTKPDKMTPMEYFLPVVPNSQGKGPSSLMSPFPPLGAALSRESLASLRAAASKRMPAPSWDPSRQDALSSTTHLEPEEPESPLVPWLIQIVRSRTGMDRIMAASVLTSLFKTGFTNTAREAELGLLVIPPLVRMLDNAEETPNDGNLVDTRTASAWFLKERTLSVLARLVTDNEFLQKCAYASHATKAVAKLLKESYEPLPTNKNSKPWSPSPRVGSASADEDASPTSKLGSRGQSPLQAHRIRMREISLKGVAALGSFKDEYRKALVDQDILPYVVESLTQTPSKPTGARDPSKNAAATVDELIVARSAYGTNRASVIIAACHVVRMLARSVSVLRTSLQDFGVAAPTLRLLRSHDLDIQNAACAAMCNLLMDVSPMRGALREMGVLETLCGHVHSLNASLRLNALWALKHFISGVGIELKKAALEQLGPGWLVQLVMEDTEDDALFARTKGERQGSQLGDDDEDVEMDQPEEETKPLQWSHSQHAKTSIDRSRSARLQQAERKIAAFREAELNPVRKARSDDLAIQEQGVNFIRNLLEGPSRNADADVFRDNTEMVDHLFSQLGQDRLFQILESKLQVKYLHPFSRRSSTPAARDSRVLYPQAPIVQAVIYALVHIAASVPRHRQIVIAQTKLLQELGKHFTSRDKEVRLALCHLIINLTWQDDASDDEGSRQRAAELRRLGLLPKLEALEQEDAELDIRERAKAAIWQINNMRKDH